MISTETGQLVVYVTEDPIDDTVISDAENVVDSRNRNIVICNLLDAFYDTSIPTREAARMLGRMKAKLGSLAESGANVVVLCRRRSGDLGTRAHFMASLCAAADQVYFRSST